MTNSDLENHDNNVKLFLSDCKRVLAEKQTVTVKQGVQTETIKHWNITMKAHNLLHDSYVIRTTGPTYYSSTFRYEKKQSLNLLQGN